MSTKLEKRRLGRTEMRPRSLALGAAWLWQKPMLKSSVAFDARLKLGINYIDTYPGHAEHLWGEALSGSRDREGSPTGTLREAGLLAGEGWHAPGTAKGFLGGWHAVERYEQSQAPSH